MRASAARSSMPIAGCKRLNESMSSERRPVRKVPIGHTSPATGSRV
jgi:hypothetical protein